MVPPGTIKPSIRHPQAVYQAPSAADFEMPNIVYALTNAAMPGIVKIGMTDRDDVRRRMSDLYTTGVPLPFDCVVAREITAGRH